MTRKDFVSLFLAILGVQLVGVLGAAFTQSSVSTWYAGLEKSALNPPGWIFGPVWTALYAVMAVAGWLVWRERHRAKGVRAALGMFAVQLALNLLWSIFFFGMQNPLLALLDITLLWLAIVVTMVLFARISKPAAWLLALYLAWVSFASFLNFQVWALN